MPRCEVLRHDQSCVPCSNPLNRRWFSQAKSVLSFNGWKDFCFSHSCLFLNLQKSCLCGAPNDVILVMASFFNWWKRTPSTCKNKIDIMLRTFLYHVLGKSICHPNSWLAITHPAVEKWCGDGKARSPTGDLRRKQIDGKASNRCPSHTPSPGEQCYLFMWEAAKNDGQNVFRSWPVVKVPKKNSPR